MEEFTIILRKHPLLGLLAVAVLTISLLPFLFVLLPFLIFIRLCSWVLARLIRGPRRRSPHPRPGSHTLTEEKLEGQERVSEESELHKQTRVNRYLEDQLKHLMPDTSNAVEDLVAEQEIYGGKIQNQLPKQGTSLNQIRETDTFTER